MKLKAIFGSGVLIAIVGVVMFSAKAIMVKIAYQYDMTTIHQLLFRMLFVLPVYLYIAFTKKPEKIEEVKKTDYFSIFAFGFIGYYLASYFDFLGLNYIKAGLERIILFVYPTLVVIISRIFLKEKINTKQIIAILITYVGVIIAFSGEVSLGGENTILGGILIFLSALTYASYLVGSGWLIPRFGVLVFTSYAMIVSTFCVVAHYLIVDRGVIFEYQTKAYIICFFMAVLSTLIPSFLVSLAIKKLGAPNFSIIASVGPISTIILAYIFLGENLSCLQIIGAIIVIVGVFVVSKARSKS